MLDTNMATLWIVLHADKLIWIYLQLTKVPYPKPDLNYGYAVLHLLEQINSILCQRWVWMIKHKMSCSTCSFSLGLAKGCPSHWDISWLQNPHSEDKCLGSWGGKYLGSGGVFRGGEGSQSELLPQSWFWSLSCLFSNCINWDVISCLLFC